MAITAAAVGPWSNSSKTSVATLTVTSASYTPAVGDLLQLTISKNNNAAVTQPTPTGWQFLDSGTVANSTTDNLTIFFFACTSTSADTSWTVSWSGTTGCAADAAIWQGADVTSTPVVSIMVQTGVTGSSTGPAATSFTPLWENALALVCICNHGNASLSSGPSAGTSLYNTFNSGTSTSGMREQCAYQIQTGTPAAFHPTWTLSTSEAWCAIAVYIKPDSNAHYLGSAGTQNVTTAASTASQAFTMAIPTGSTVVFSVFSYNPTTSGDLNSITDTAGNTYVSKGHGSDGFDFDSSTWACVGTTAALTTSDTWTVTFHSSVGDHMVSVDVFDSSTVDVQLTNNVGTGATVTTPSCTLTSGTANDLLFFGWLDSANHTMTRPTSVYVEVFYLTDLSTNDMAAGLRAPGAAGTYSASATNGAGTFGGMGFVYAFGAAASGPTSIGPITDSAAGSESVATAIQAPLTDSAAGTEATPPIAIQAPLTDSGAGTEQAYACKQWYISTTGNDTTGDGSITNPWATITHARSSLGPGDTVHIANGTYTEAPFINVSGVSGYPITFQSINKWGALFQAPSGNGNNPTIDISGQYVIIDGLEVTNTVTVGSYGISCEGANVTVRNCKVHDVSTSAAGVGGAGIGTGNSADFTETGHLIENNLIYNIGFAGDSGQHGIYLRCPQGIARNNVIGNISGNGLQAYHNGTQSTVVNNTIFNVGNNGVLIGQDIVNFPPSSGSVVVNNIFYACTLNGVHEDTSETSGNTLGWNIFFNNGGTDYHFVTGDTSSNDIDADPKFTAYQANATGDYHVQTTSGALGAGNSTYTPAKDFEGVTRTDATIGAYQIARDILTDSGAGTEQLAIKIAAPLTDSATGSESLTVFVTQPIGPITDSATGSESLLVNVQAGLTDSAAGSNSGQPVILIQPTITDSASGTEGLVVNLQLPPITDSAVGSEGLTVFVSQPIGPITDSATGSETVNITNITVSVTDTASGTEVQSFNITAPLVDSAAGSDLAAVNVKVSVTDNATGSETIAIPLIQPQLLDSALGGDSLTATIQALITDSGTGSENVSLGGNQSFTLTDSAAGTESVGVVAVTAALADSATGSQTVTGTITFPLNDAALGSEAMTANIIVPVVDAASGSEALSAKVQLTLFDSASGAELQVVIYDLSVADAAAGSDIVNVNKAVNLTSFTVTDVTGHGSEILSVVKGYFIFLGDLNSTAPSASMVGPAASNVSWVNGSPQAVLPE